LHWQDLWATVSGMSRNLILIFGLICWTGVAINAVVHLAFGDWLLPVAMAVFFALWTALFVRYSRTAARA